MKGENTPLSSLKDTIVPVKGFREPFIYVENKKHFLSKNDARQMAKRFAVKTFMKKYNVKLTGTQEQPKREGQYRITRLHGRDKNQIFKVEFFILLHLVRFEFTLSARASGVSSREIFKILEKIVKGNFHRPEGWDISYWKIFTCRKSSWLYILKKPHIHVAFFINYFRLPPPTDRIHNIKENSKSSNSHYHK